MTIRSMAMSQLRTHSFRGLDEFGVGQIDRPGSQVRNTPQTNAQIRAAGDAISGAMSAVLGQDAGIEGRTSNADAVSVAVNNNRTIASMPPRDAVIDVAQLATAQENEGMAMNAAGLVGEGNFAFSITAGGRERTFNIAVGADDDVATVQARMASAINTANIGVTASVEASDGNTALTLTGDQTGAANAFTVTDLSGDLAEFMGIDTATTAAQNAVFSVNGDARTSATNEISLAAGVTATLEGEGEATISFGRTAGQAASAAQDFVNAINSAIRGTNPNDGRGSQRFLNDLIGMNINFEASLNRVGINVARNGQLSIDQSRLNAAAEDGSLERFFESSGFAARAERVAFNASGTNHYANRPPSVHLTANNFDFATSNNQWAMMDLFG
jgi:flagellar capping protein FliD